MRQHEQDDGVDVNLNVDKFYGEPYYGIDFGYSVPAAGYGFASTASFSWWIFDGFYRRGLTNIDIQNLIGLKEQGLGRVIEDWRFSPGVRHQAA